MQCIECKAKNETVCIRICGYANMLKKSFRNIGTLCVCIWISIKFGIVDLKCSKFIIHKRFSHEIYQHQTDPKLKILHAIARSKMRIFIILLCQWRQSYWFNSMFENNVVFQQHLIHYLTIFLIETQMAHVYAYVLNVYCKVYKYPV